MIGRPPTTKERLRIHRGQAMPSRERDDQRAGCATPIRSVTTIRPPFDWRAKVVTARFDLAGSRTLTGSISTPSAGATDWMAAELAYPGLFAASRSTATRVTCGAICLSNSSHFAPQHIRTELNPVALPPGRARLVDMTAPTGSVDVARTRLAQCGSCLLQCSRRSGCRRLG